MFCSLGAQQLEMTQKEKDLGGFVAHSKAIKKSCAAWSLSKAQENIQDTSKVPAGTMWDFRLLSSGKVKWEWSKARKGR